MSTLTKQQNPILDWYDKPDFDQITAEHVSPAVESILETNYQWLADLEEDTPLSPGLLLARMEQIEDSFFSRWAIVLHLSAVRNSPALRDAIRENQSKIVAFSNRYGQSKPLFDALSKIRNGTEWQTLTEAQQRLITIKLHSANLAGVALEGSARERFNDVSQRLAELKTKFQNNVIDAVKEFSLILTDPADVAGIPETWREIAAGAARRDGHDSATATDGPWAVKLDRPNYTPFMSHCRHRGLREQIHRAYETRASAGEIDNTPIIREILQLRAEMAQLLGFENYAELSLSSKMAPSVAAVSNLLDDLHQAAYPVAVSETAKLRKLAQQEGAPEGDDFRDWDILYWIERLREATFDLEEEELRPYFPLPQVLEGLFDVAQKLFDISVVPANGEAPVWHADVTYYKVFDNQGQQLSAFYFDPYSRPAEKRGGAWANVQQSRSKTMAAPDDDVRLPVAYMCCNQSPPTPGKPSLMTFREVLTLFHEFGHDLQHLLTTVDLGPVSGLSNIEWDAVELASQFMENWCYHKPTLQAMARHFETGDPLPDEIIDRLIGARAFMGGYTMIRQINFGRVDIALHTTFDPHKESSHEIQHRIMSDTMVIAPPDYNRFLCAMTHLFSGAYAAGYYSYKWAEVLSADAFSAFQEAGLEDVNAVQELGHRFRDTVLALGGSRHPMDVFVDFRGREPEATPLLEQYALV